MKTYSKKVLRVVVDYAQNLIPVHKNSRFYVQESKTPIKDAEALFCLINGNTFCEYARNGSQYLYCFLFDEKDIKLAKYILQSNGIKPRLHISRYYNTPVLALRARVTDIENNARAKEFMSYLMKQRSDFRINSKLATAHLEQIQQKIK